jgi:hypothetical protein
LAALSIIGLLSFILFIFKNFNANRYGKILSYVNNPTPGKSMFDSLEEEGVKLANIKELYIMTYDLKNKYHIDSEYNKILKKNGSEYKFNMIGFGKEEDITELNKEFKNLKVRVLKKHHTEHLNLIKTSKDTYLWYEPYHKSIENKEILNEGAYLVNIDSKKYTALTEKLDNLQ